MPATMLERNRACCQRKKAYWREEDARQVLQKLRARGGHYAIVDCYRCEACTLWHLGHIPDDLPMSPEKGTPMALRLHAPRIPLMIKDEVVDINALQVIPASLKGKDALLYALTRALLYLEYTINTLKEDGAHPQPPQPLSVQQQVTHLEHECVFVRNLLKEVKFHRQLHFEQLMQKRKDRYMRSQRATTTAEAVSFQAHAKAVLPPSVFSAILLKVGTPLPQEALHGD